jgi:hypothetical protein
MATRAVHKLIISLHEFDFGWTPFVDNAGIRLGDFFFASPGFYSDADIIGRGRLYASV